MVLLALLAMDVAHPLGVGGHNRAIRMISLFLHVMMFHLRVTITETKFQILL